MVFAVEDLLGERLGGEVVPTQVDVREERQVLKGPDNIHNSIHTASIHINSVHSLFLDCVILSCGHDSDNFTHPRTILLPSFMHLELRKYDAR